MKTLILLRHAKSSWKDPYLSDHDRPLNKRGKRDAPLMARVYKRHFSSPDLILCSSSERTKATANAFIQELGIGVEKLEYERGLYHADAFEMLRIISLVDSGVNTLLVIGHNPGITILANVFKPGLTQNIPTCGMAAFRKPGDSWLDFTSKEDVDCIGYFAPKLI